MKVLCKNLTVVTSDQNVHELMKPFGHVGRAWGSAWSDVALTCRSWKTRLNLRQQVHNCRPAAWKCHENTANRTGFVSAVHKEAVTVSLCNYPAFGHIDLTMCIGEQLTILSEWVKPLSVFHLLLRFDLDTLVTPYFPSTATATFWLLDPWLRAWRATFPPATPPSWLTRKSQGKAEELCEVGGFPCLVGGVSVNLYISGDRHLEQELNSLR